MNFSGKRHHGSAAGFACSYLILLIIPVLMGISTYAGSVRLSRDALVETQRMALQQCGESLSNSLDAACQFALSVAATNKSQWMFSDKSAGSGTRVFAVREAIENLPLNMDSNNLTTNYFVIDFASDIIIRPRAGYLSSRTYFDVMVGGTEREYAAWYDTIFNMEAGRIYALARAESEEAILIFGHPFSAFTGGKTAYEIVFHLDAKEIRRLLEPVFSAGITTISLLDQNGTMLLEMQSESKDSMADEISGMDFAENGSRFIELENGRMLLTAWNGENFILVSAIPDRNVAMRSSQILHTILRYILAFLLAEIVLGIWMMCRNQRPVNRMLSHLELRPGGWHGVGLSDIESAVHDLVQNTKTLQQSLQEQKQMLRNAYINRLVFGDILDEDELGTLDFLPASGSIRGIYMRLKEEAGVDMSMDYLRAQILEQLRCFAPRLRLISLTAANCFALLYSAPAEETDQYAELLRTVYTRLRFGTGIEVAFYVGHSCTQVKYVYESFSAAAALMSHISDDEERFLWEAEAAYSRHNSKWNWMQEEQKLSNLIAVGDMGRIREFLEKLYHEHFDGEDMDAFTLKLIYYRIIGTLVSANSEIPLQPELRYSTSSLSPEQFFSFVETHCDKLCMYARHQKQQQAETLIRNVQEYVDQNYNNPNISLCSVAMKFGLTESYLSVFIKEKLGETFSARIERLRIAEANRLLRESKMSIGAVAEAVGYTSANTFRRAFRRIQGFSPSDCREGKNE